MRRLFWALAVLAVAAVASPVALAGDREIAQSIVQKLESEKQAGKLKGFGIDLEVDEGVVTIKGQVATEEQQRAVLEIARWTKGVTKVKNGIRVNGSIGGGQVAGVPSPSGVPTPSSRRTPVDNNTVAANASAAQGVPSVKAPSLFGDDAQSKARLAAARERAVAESREREAKEAQIRSQQREYVERQAELRREKEGVIREMLDRERSVRQAAATQADLEASKILQASNMTGSNPIPAPPSEKSVRSGAATQQNLKPLPSRSQVPSPSARVAYAGPMSQAPVYRNQGAAYPVHPAAMQGRPQMQPAAYHQPGAMPTHAMAGAQPIASHPPGYVPVSGGISPARYDHPYMPAYSWPSYASYPNYAAVTYPKQYSAQAWPYIGPFHPYPQVPLGWRKVTLEWDDGWWMLDFRSK